MLPKVLCWHPTTATLASNPTVTEGSMATGSMATAKMNHYPYISHLGNKLLLLLVSTKFVVSCEIMVTH